MKLPRIYLINGQPVVSQIYDDVWSAPHENGDANSFWVYAANGNSQNPSVRRFIKAANADEAVRGAGNPFGDLATSGWESI
jgi:hypothetical protein